MLIGLIRIIFFFLTLYIIVNVIKLFLHLLSNDASSNEMKNSYHYKNYNGDRIIELDKDDYKVE